MARDAESAGVVVGIDGSATSRIAVHWAAREAERRGLPLTLVHAASTELSPRVARWMVFGQHELPHRRVQRIIDDAVDIAGDSARHDGPTQVNPKLVFTDPIDTLVEMSRKAELVVVGSRRRRRLWHALTGSVGSALTERSRCPVAVIEDQAPRMPHPGHAPTRTSVTGW
ncbi:universal stress protein [Mycolicibacter algericus]|uniref:UspA domain-containing protein n=2 Tax=Mycolicibacter algericus TaxID=1288388 RepID=A0A7I9YC76_MYCAL|nr:universal stress protein [Mycolicibacter algericus]OQZ99706.1 hypothetical protein BST10_01895 [Mycolicibacter algericus DSM 45454]GFG86214.1 hypothetical protein MALGJ_28900 [Mycolicibacter algericus]